MTGAAYRRWFVLPGILAILIVVNVRVMYSGHENLDIARRCAAIGLNDTAIDHYARAARWYTPLTSTSSDAIYGLLAIGEGSAQRGDAKTAKKALQEARGAILASRWLFTPHSDDLTVVNHRLAELQASDAEPGSPASDVESNLALLERTNLPNPWLSLLSTMLFVAWIAVTVVGASRVVTRGGMFAGRAGVLWIAGSALLLGGWLFVLAIV